MSFYGSRRFRVPGVIRANPNDYISTRRAKR
jgi:hypothetical protein